MNLARVLRALAAFGAVQEVDEEGYAFRRPLSFFLTRHLQMAWTNGKIQMRIWKRRY